MGAAEEQEGVKMVSFPVESSSLLLPVTYFLRNLTLED